MRIRNNSLGHNVSSMNKQYNHTHANSHSINSINCIPNHNQNQNHNFVINNNIITNKKRQLTDKLRQRFSYTPSDGANKCLTKIRNIKGSSGVGASSLGMNQQNQNPNHCNHHVQSYQQHHDSIQQCEYSSVKYAKQQINDENCGNDTSSWIAKLVHNIQQEDERNLHKLSQIEILSVGGEEDVQGKESEGGEEGEVEENNQNQEQEEQEEQNYQVDNRQEFQRDQQEEAGNQFLFRGRGRIKGERLFTQQEYQQQQNGENGNSKNEDQSQPQQQQSGYSNYYMHGTDYYATKNSDSSKSSLKASALFKPTSSLKREIFQGALKQSSNNNHHLNRNHNKMSKSNYPQSRPKSKNKLRSLLIPTSKISPDNNIMKPTPTHTFNQSLTLSLSPIPIAFNSVQIQQQCDPIQTQAVPPVTRSSSNQSKSAKTTKKDHLQQQSEHSQSINSRESINLHHPLHNTSVLVVDKDFLEQEFEEQQEGSQKNPYKSKQERKRQCQRQYDNCATTKMISATAKVSKQKSKKKNEQKDVLKSQPLLSQQINCKKIANSRNSNSLINSNSTAKVSKINKQKVGSQYKGSRSPSPTPISGPNPTPTKKTPLTQSLQQPEQAFAFSSKKVSPHRQRRQQHKRSNSNTSNGNKPKGNLLQIKKNNQNSNNHCDKNKGQMFFIKKNSTILLQKDSLAVANLMATETADFAKKQKQGSSSGNSGNINKHNNSSIILDYDMEDNEGDNYDLGMHQQQMSRNLFNIQKLFTDDDNDQQAKQHKLGVNNNIGSNGDKKAGSIKKNSCSSNRALTTTAAAAVARLLIGHHKASNTSSQVTSQTTSQATSQVTSQTASLQSSLGLQQYGRGKIYRENQQQQGQTSHNLNAKVPSFSKSIIEMKAKHDIKKPIRSTAVHTKDFYLQQDNKIVHNDSQQSSFINNEKIFVELQADFRKNKGMGMITEQNNNNYVINNIQSSNPTHTHIPFNEQNPITFSNTLTKTITKTNPSSPKQTHPEIQQLFDRIRLNKDNLILSKKNLKLRGLSQKQKNQLQPIISKIHNGNEEFTYGMFEHYYRETCIAVVDDADQQHKHYTQLQQQNNQHKEKQAQMVITAVEPDIPSLGNQHNNHYYEITSKQSTSSSLPSSCKHQIINIINDQNKYQQNKEKDNKQIKNNYNTNINNTINKRYNYNKLAIKDNNQQCQQQQKQIKKQRLRSVSLSVPSSSPADSMSIHNYLCKNQTNICKDPYIEESSSISVCETMDFVTNKILQQITERSRQYTEANSERDEVQGEGDGLKLRSRTGSRTGSRAGSRAGTAVGSRVPSGTQTPTSVQTQRQREYHLNNMKKIVIQERKQIENRVMMQQSLRRNNRDKLNEKYKDLDSEDRFITDINHQHQQQHRFRGREGQQNTNMYNNNERHYTDPNSKSYHAANSSVDAAHNSRDCLIEKLNKKLTSYISTNKLESTFKQFNLNFSELKKHIR